MTDFASNFTLGERRNDARTKVVKYTETIAKGDLLKITGVETNNILKVAKQTLTTQAAFIALEAGKNGEIKEALFEGTTKVTFGGNVTPGKKCAPKANEILDTGSTGVGPDCGIIISDGAADADTGLIYFVGVGN